jgi:hypothetical protein
LQEIENTDQTSLIEPIVLDVQRTSFDGNNVEFKRNVKIKFTHFLKIKKYNFILFFTPPPNLGHFKYFKSRLLQNTKRQLLPRNELYRRVYLPNDK